MELDPQDTELVIGIVARIGVDTKSVVRCLSAELTEYSYRVEEIHVTDVLSAFSTKLHLSASPLEQRYATYIAACNQLREDTGAGVMAELAIMQIAARRGNVDSAAPEQHRNAFIVNQIKRPEESETLRKVYGEHYVQVSCHANEDVRIKVLTESISQGRPEDPKSTS